LPIVLDIIAVAIVVLFAIIGYNAGFVKTIIELIGWIAVLLFASVLANQISGFIFDCFISEPIIKSVEKSVAEFGANGVNEYFNGLPDLIQRLLNAYGINAESVGATIDSNQIAVAIVEQIKMPIVSLISFIFNVIIFVLGIILVRLLARVCNSVVSRIPLVSGLNRTLGFVSGVAKGFVITAVFCWIFSFFILFTGGFLGVTYETVCDTQLIRFLNEMNPMSKIF